MKRASDRKQRRTVLDCALTLLGRKPYSFEGLRVELERREYKPEEVKEALDRLIEWGYIDDRFYSATQIESLLSAGRSRLFIEGKLQKAGVSPEIIREELERLYPPSKERELIENLWEGFHSKIGERKPTRQERMKWARKLLAAGFFWEDIQVCFEQEEDT